MQFDLMRLSLLSRADLYVKRKTDGNIETREEWIRKIFSKKITFLHRQDSFQFIPLMEDFKDKKNLIVGRIGREISVQENAPPEFDFRNITRPAWKASEVVIDPTHHADGQKVAFAAKPAMGTPLSVFLSLSAFINNSDPPEPYVIEVESISDPKSFWDFARENEGDVTKVSFEFIAPNMFGAVDDYEKEMQELRDNEKITKLRLNIENPNGLILDTERVKSAVNYTTRGGGAITAKAKNNRKFSSRNSTKRIVIDSDNGNDIFSLIGGAISAIFKR